MIAVKIGKNYRIVIPKKVRDLLGLKPGDKLLISLEKGKMVLLPQPKSYTERLRGLHKEIWHDTEATEYVLKEREAWGS